MSRFVLIGGGELRLRETMEIDEYLVSLAKEHAGERRARALFFPTASHDCMPYYNTFHKVYTGALGISTDVALVAERDPDPARLEEKFARADLIYVGGGDTVFLIDVWKKKGILPLLKDAGAICWFEEMYSDSVVEGEFSMYPGLGWLKGKISPHYDERMLDFDEIVRYNRWRAWGLENRAALEIEDGEPVRSISAGGKVYLLDGTDGKKVIRREF